MRGNETGTRLAIEESHRPPQKPYDNPPALSLPKGACPMELNRRPQFSHFITRLAAARRAGHLPPAPPILFSRSACGARPAHLLSSRLSHHYSLGPAAPLRHQKSLSQPRTVEWIHSMPGKAEMTRSTLSSSTLYPLPQAGGWKGLAFPIYRLGLRSDAALVRVVLIEIPTQLRIPHQINAPNTAAKTFATNDKSVRMVRKGITWKNVGIAVVLSERWKHRASGKVEWCAVNAGVFLKAQLPHRKVVKTTRRL